MGYLEDRMRDFEKYFLNWRVTFEYFAPLDIIRYTAYVKSPMHWGTHRIDWDFYPESDIVKGIRDKSIDLLEYAFNEENIDQLMMMGLSDILDYAFLCMYVDKNPVIEYNPWIEKDSAKRYEERRDKKLKEENDSNH